MPRKNILPCDIKIINHLKITFKTSVEEVPGGICIHIRPCSKQEEQEAFRKAQVQ